MSQAARNRRNRMDNKVRGNMNVGGVRVDATQYVTGRTTVDTLTLVPRNAEQAAYAYTGIEHSD